MSLAVGDITKIEYADAFSVEASSVNSSLVNKVHNSGKEIYAWTVNKESSINHMIDMGVDNIITDNIELAKDLISTSNYSYFVKELINFLRQ
jgi:glycerophosphoryl diester phosphodiesterase